MMNNLFLWLESLTLPTLMILIGCMTNLIPSGHPNHAFGYRTPGSMKSQETWDYAQKRMGTLWFWFGVAVLTVSVIGNIYFPTEYAAVRNLVVGICAILLSLLLIERDLKNLFDESGVRIHKK